MVTDDLKARRRRNGEAGGLIAGAVLAVLGLAAMVIPSLAGADMMAYGYALAFVGLFILIVGLVVLAFYIPRYRIMQRMLDGRDLLACWEIEPATWRAHLERDYARDQAGKRGLFWVVVVLMVIIGTPFVLVDPEAGVWVLAALAGTAGAIAIVAFLVPRLRRRQNLERPGEVLISAEGISAGGQLTVWKTITSRLQRAELTGHDPTLIELEMAYLSRVGYQTYEVRVPVPAGQEPLAQQVIVALAPGKRDRTDRTQAEQTPQTRQEE